MDIKRQSFNRRQRPRDPLERRMDQLFETGRQFVDGVAGNRPGVRRKDNLPISANRMKLQNAGRWMGEKLEWFFEEGDEYDDWSDFSKSQKTTVTDNNHVKRPLEAISLRMPKAIPSSVGSLSETVPLDEWPDESSFKIDRWQRTGLDNDDGARRSFLHNQRKSSAKRVIPKSSRRKN